MFKPGLFAAAILVAGVTILAYVSYQRGESKSHKIHSSSCMVMGIADIVLEHYLVEREFPTSESLVSLYRDQISHLGSGRITEIDGSLVLDSFGDPICYNWHSAQRVVIFSRNVPGDFFPERSDDYRGFELIDGNTLPIVVSKGTRCGSSH